MAAETAAGAATAAVAAGLFSYNRENYLYDAEFRFERFVTGREFAVQQMQQYRGDLRALTSLTVKKNNMYATIATLTMSVCVVLYSSGRLGLHGPPPPGWIMALFLTNVAASFCFMAITIFLALHASFRAHAASVQLLTRKARLQVPSMKQLDRSRRFASEFEQQSWGDIFRIPYLTNNGAPKTDDVIQERRPQSVPPAMARRARSKASSWVRDEFDTDRAGVVSGPANVAVIPDNTAPEHFRLYAAVQKQWFQYEVYARVSLFYGFRCLLHALALYGIIHVIVELRAFWAAWTLAFVIEVLHFLIVRFEIVPGHNRHRQDRLPHCQYFGHSATLFAAIALGLDFRVTFDMTAVGVSWSAVLLAYICEILYQLRMLEVVLPDDPRSPFQTEDRIGSAWWPERWGVPSLFTHVLFFVAPPETLQPGQHDLVREVREGVGMDVWDGFANGPVPPGSDVKKPMMLQGDSHEDLIAKVQYVDRLFEWVFSNEVFEAMTVSGKTKVRELYRAFADTRSAGPDAKILPQVLQDSLTGLEAIVASEGLPDMHAATYGSESDYDFSVSDFSAAEGTTAPAKPRKTSKNIYPSPAAQGPEPWRLVSLVQLVFTSVWMFLICTVVVDIVIGDQSLLNGPHWNRPPMTRQVQTPSALGTPLGIPYSADSIPVIPEQLAWTEEHRAPGTTIIGAPPGRRLATGFTKLAEPAPAPELLRAALDNLLKAVSAEMKATSSPTVEPSIAAVSWPTFFEPKLLACSPSGAVMALTARGFGAIATLEGDSEHATAFSLRGLGNLPTLLAANWGALQHEDQNEGLMVVTNQGHLATCPGQAPAPGGSWPCSTMKAVSRLPLENGARLSAAAMAWLTQDGGSPRLHAALVEESSPEMASLFVLESSASWIPLGEILLPSGKALSLSFDSGALIITTAAGDVVRRRLQDGAATGKAAHSFAHLAASGDFAWAGACGRMGGAAHLVMKRDHGRLAWRPNVLVAETFAVEIRQ